MTEGNHKVRAGIYCRISLAVLGDTTKTGEQERLCRQVCAQRGWVVARVYTDNSRSAWQRTRRRPGWEQMLADTREGQIEAIVSYWGDRLVRQPRDLEDLLDLRDRRPGLSIASVSGTYDLDNSDHRMMMRWEVARACNESDTISRRRLASVAARAQKGIAPPAAGRYKRGFGYDPAGRVPVHEEAEALREATRRVLAGERLTAIAADLTARGIRSVSGAPVTLRLLKEILLRPRIAGLMADGSPGSWPAIIEPEQQRELAEVLSGRAAGRAWSNSGRYLLSGIAQCGACGTGLQRTSHGPAGRMTLAYGCVQPGCRKIGRDMALLDAYVTRMTVNRLNHPANPPGEIPDSPLGAELAQLLVQRGETETAIADPEQGARLGLLLLRLDALDKRLAEVRELAAGDAAARLRSAHSRMSEREFQALPLSSKRALVSACFTITVLPASRRGPGFRSEDVTMSPKGQSSLT